MDEHLKIKDTPLADEYLKPFPREDNQYPRHETNLGIDPNFVYVIFSLVIFAFNIVATVIALISISKGYDPYIHASAMFISVFTLGCIAAIHKFILKEI